MTKASTKLTEAMIADWANLADDLLTVLAESDTPQDKRQRLGIELKKMRMETEMSCEQVAEKIGVAHGTVYNYENGDTKIPLEQAANLLKLYRSKTGKKYSLDALVGLN